MNEELEKLREIKNIALNQIKVNEEVKTEEKVPTVQKSIFNENEFPLPKSEQFPLD